MKRKKKVTLLPLLLIFVCLLSACGFSDKNETDITATKESLTENWNSDRDEESTSEGVLESLGEDIKDGAESMGEDIKNGAESVGEDIKNGAESIGNEIKDGMDGTNGETNFPSEPNN